MTTHASPAKRDRDLMSWWKRFQSRDKKEVKKGKVPNYLDPGVHVTLASPRFSSMFHELPSTSSLHHRTTPLHRAPWSMPAASWPPSSRQPSALPGSVATLQCRRNSPETSSRVPPAEAERALSSRLSGTSSTQAHAPLSLPPTIIVKTSALSFRSRVKTILHIGRFTHASHPTEEQPTGIFAVPLSVSIKYANVAISLTDAEGKSFIYGYVPIVVAKCGVFLKEKGWSTASEIQCWTSIGFVLIIFIILATDVEGIFRLSGSAKRIKDLQTLFDSPDRYGKGLDWTGYTVHDAANILRRYLNQLPEPVVPLDFYERFREPLRNHETEAVGDLEAQAHDVGGFNEEATIKIYQQMITELPPLSRQLLLYILDLLAVFASKSDLNRMSSTNLAAIFQPGMLSHPSHDMNPGEYRLSQDILVFLIEKQDHFLIGMRGTAADDETVKEVQSGGSPAATTPTTPSRARPVNDMGRSSSAASAGADSVRRFGGIRRNVSVSSKQSKHSTNVPSPISPAPASPGAGSVHRSNTVPSKKSPALPSGRFGKPPDSSTPPSADVTRPAGTGVHLPIAQAFSSEPQDPAKPEGGEEGGDNKAATSEPTVSTAQATAGQATSSQAPANQASNDNQLLDPSTAVTRDQPSSTQTRERGFSTFFSRSPTSDTERRDGKGPKKLRKKRVPGSANQSAHSSTGSLAEA